MDCEKKEKDREELISDGSTLGFIVFVGSIFLMMMTMFIIWNVIKLIVR